MALGEGGVFRTVRLTDHSTTQLVLLGIFLGTQSKVVEEGAHVVRVEITGRR